MPCQGLYLRALVLCTNAEDIQQPLDTKKAKAYCIGIKVNFRFLFHFRTKVN